MTENKTSIVEYMSLPNVQANINQTLKDRGPEFVASVAALVNSNPALAACSKKSILSACLIAASLDLVINQNLGLAYVIPYNVKVKETIVDAETGKSRVVERWESQAQFQMSVKGFKQLAIRTGKYKHLNDSDVREGEYGGENRLTGEYIFNWVQDVAEREKLPIVGYLAYLELNSGFTKTLYMTVEQLTQHGMHYSKTFAKGFGNWKDSFDAMCRKTVVKLLISRYGLVSSRDQAGLQLAKAVESDQAVLTDDKVKYVDNQPLDVNEVAADKERARIIKHIAEAKTGVELFACSQAANESQDDEIIELFNKKQNELSEGEGKE